MINRKKGESWASFQKRKADEQAKAEARFAAHERLGWSMTQERKNADRIDGYDRDDLGLSNDY
jgi:hypothetical protein